MGRLAPNILLAIAVASWPALVGAEDAPDAPAPGPQEGAEAEVNPPEAVEPEPAPAPEPERQADAGEIEALAAVLEPGNVQARVDAVVALGARAGDPAAVAALIDVLHADPAPEVRAHAVHALAAISPENRAIDEAQQQDPDSRVTGVAGLVARQARDNRSEVARRDGTTSVTIGLSLGCLSYGISVLAGLITGLVELSDGGEPSDHVGWWYLIPLAGPFFAAPRGDEPEKLYMIGALDAVFQATGIALLFVGLAQHVRYGRETRERSLLFAPVVRDGQASLAVMGVF